ncbi:MAG: hypothetical protein IJX20_03850 [Alphaproteobacteria bacterium]|nr:hypothetical protein [Alphaproteobacteria bacterium]
MFNTSLNNPSSSDYDFDNGVSKSVNTNYVAEKSGYFVVQSVGGGGFQSGSIIIGSNTWGYTNLDGTKWVGGFPVTKGDTYKYTQGSAKFFPKK